MTGMNSASPDSHPHPFAYPSQNNDMRVRNSNLSASVFDLSQQAGMRTPKYPSQGWNQPQMMHQVNYETNLHGILPFYFIFLKKAISIQFVD